LANPEANLRLNQNVVRPALRGTKFGGGGKARAGKNSFPPTPFLFARPSDWISEFAVRIFVKKSSDFNQKVPLCAGKTIIPERVSKVRILPLPLWAGKTATKVLNKWRIPACR